LSLGLLFVRSAFGFWKQAPVDVCTPVIGEKYGLAIPGSLPELVVQFL